MWSKNDHRGVGTRRWHPFESIHAIFPNDLKMRIVSARFVPSGFCITMMHRATHRLLCSNSSPRKAFLSSPNHRTLWISLRVTFGCSLFWKRASRGRVSHHGWHRNECDGRTPEDSKRSLPPVHPTMVGSMEQVCVCARVRLWMWLGKRCHMSYHYSAIPQFRELCDCPSYSFITRHFMMQGNTLQSTGYQPVRQTTQYKEPQLRASQY